MTVTPSIYHFGFAVLIEVDRRLSGRGLVLSELAANLEISRSTAARYLQLIVVRIGLSVTCRFCVSGKVLPAIEALEIKGRGRRVYKYDEGCEGLFTKEARRCSREAWQ